MSEEQGDSPRSPGPGMRRLRDGRQLRFRNYRPRHEALRELFEKTPRAILYLDLSDGAKEGVQGEHKKAMDALTAIQRELQEELAQQDPDVTNIAPKKATWDLERDIAKKLQKLERRTQRSIIELLRARLAAEEETEESSESEDDLE